MEVFRKVVDENFDFFNYAGIHKPVKIYTTNKNRIEDIAINYDVNLAEKKADINFNVKVDGEFDKVVIELFDEEESLVGKTENEKLHLLSMISFNINSIILNVKMKEFTKLVSILKNILLTLIFCIMV